MARADSANDELRLGRYLKHAWANRTNTSDEAALSWSTQDGGVELNRDGAIAFRDAVELLFHIEEIGSRVSERVIEDQLWRELLALGRLPNVAIVKNANESAHKVLQQLLNYPVETCKVNFPVFGLEVIPSSFEIDIGDVVIYDIRSPHKETECSKWLQDYSSSVLASDLNVNLEGKSVPRGSFCWAKATIQANRNDANRLRQEGARLIRESLALLCLFVFAYPRKDPRRQLHWVQEPMLDISNVELAHREGYVTEFMIDGQYRSSLSTYGSARNIAPYSISCSVVNAFAKEGFQACGEVLGKQNPNQLEMRVRKALDYFSIGMQTFNVFQRYVMYTASLEALLMKENELGVARKLPKRASWLLESDQKKRDQLHSLVSWAYGIRCDIVHGESPSTVLAEEGLRYLRFVLYSIVKRLVTGSEHFTSVDDIVEWVKR